jgi:hypothetical protein
VELSQIASVGVPQNVNCHVYSHTDSTYGDTNYTATGVTCPFALAAGRFRSSVVNEDLALVAQAYTFPSGGQAVPGPTGLTVYSIEMGKNGAGQLVGTLANTSFINAGQSSGDTTVKVIATSAAIENWVSNEDQLVIVNDTSSGYGGHVYIGSYNPSFSFSLQSDTNVTDGHSGCVYSAAVGNFDSVDSNGGPTATLALATYWVTNVSDCNVNSNNSQPQFRI